jgi:polysaccharide deacetylase 2 family uncharacterized protein YibQ
MNSLKRYRITIWVLSLVIVIQGLFILALIRPRKIPKAIPPVVAVKGRIAVVLDDWGYNLNNLGLLEEIKYPLTISILPNLSYSKEVAEEAHSRGLEVILHLPMEPREKLRLEKNTIMSGMSKEAIKKILMQDLLDIPYVRGVSNHMGSAATEDPKVMATVFGQLKKNGLYFLDSLVATRSVGSEIARNTGVKFTRRDVFLDNIQDPKYIKGQIFQLKAKARMRGEAIGIGHDRKVTLEVLKEIMPQMSKEGYKFVFVSELAK